jgi:glycosyltransferase involved in cell wall biosynthesis
MPSSPPRLLVVFYANPDQYPPTYNAVSLLRACFRVRVVSRRTERESRSYPEDVRLDRVGAARSAQEAAAQSAPRKLADFLEFVAAVRRAIREDAPRVIYAYDPYAIVAVALAGGRAPLVYQRHEVEELDRISRRSLGGWVLRASLPLSRRAALVVFPDRGRAEYYARFVPGLPEPMIVPNFPLRATFPAPDLASLVDGRFERRQVFYRGALGGSNGLREAVRAFARVAPPASLRLCGPGSPDFVRELEALATELGVRDRVDLAGFIPSFDQLNRETLAGSVGLLLYRAVDTNWAWSASAVNKLYEYAACGMPALAPDRASYREFLGGEDWVELVDEADPAAIAAAIERVLSDRARYAERCRAARRAFEERFNYESAFAPLRDRIVALAG